MCRNMSNTSLGLVEMLIYETHEMLCRHCDAIDELWAAKDYALESFPDIVLSTTEGVDLTPFGAIEDIMTLFADPGIANLQALSSFSDLYVKLYDNGRFWVEILNWWGSDINIHDHDFSGVQFQLRGRSWNVDYLFDEIEAVGEMRLGDVSIADAQIWSEGDRSVVLPGRQYLHNVCHLDVPTVSLLIRTHPQPSFGPQWNYFPPGVAANYGIADVVFRKRVKALRLLAKGDRQIFLDAFRSYRADLTLEQLIFTLVKMIDILFNKDFVEIVHEILTPGDQLTERIVEAASYHRATEAIKLLKNTTDLSQQEIVVLSIMGSSFDRDSVEYIVDCLSRDGHYVDFPGSVAGLREKLKPTQQRTLENTLSLFGLADPDQVLTN